MKFIAKQRETVEAWKYEAGKDVPVWVARRCHDYGDGKLTATTVAGRLTIDVGDYVVLIDAETNSVMVASGAVFDEQYEPLPQPAAT